MVTTAEMANVVIDISRMFATKYKKIQLHTVKKSSRRSSNGSLTEMPTCSCTPWRWVDTDESFPISWLGSSQL